MRFNSKLTGLAFATVAAIASLNAQASSIEVKVKGTISPAACTPTMAGGGEINYGTIPAANVKATEFTVLDDKPVAFSISCSAPTKVALRATDNRASSRISGVQSAINGSYSNNANFGLGAVAGKNVGGYVMLINQDSYTADTASVKTVASLDTGTTWVNTSGTLNNISNVLTSWSATAGGLPVSFKELAGTLTVRTALNKASELTLTSDVPLDGSATLELVYL